MPEENGKKRFHRTNKGKLTLASIPIIISIFMFVDNYYIPNKINANENVQQIRELKNTVKDLKETNQSLDHSVRELEKFKSWLEGKLDAKIH